MDAQNLSQFHLSLTNWYEKSGRKYLPWRKLGRILDSQSSSQSLFMRTKKILEEHPNIPYEVYVSEIMLQQTRVSFVLFYYERFLKRFNSLKTLAYATEDEVLKLWAGLGYYSRAKNLLKTAKICINQDPKNDHPTLPHEPQELKKLPGIGDYSAGAISCFGFGNSISFWDGNIKRFLSRLFAQVNPKKSTLDELSKKILNPQNPYNHNQALIDLGSLICTKTHPKCNLCPAFNFCLGKKQPLNYDISIKKEKIKVELTLALIQTQESLALIRDERFNGLYCLPEICSTSSQENPFFTGKSHTKVSTQMLNSYLTLKPHMTIKHNRTKFNITAKIYKLPPSCITNPKIEWVNPTEVPLCALTSKALNLFKTSSP